MKAEDILNEENLEELQRLIGILDPSDQLAMLGILSNYRVREDRDKSIDKQVDFVMTTTADLLKKLLEEKEND